MYTKGTSSRLRAHTPRYMLHIGRDTLLRDAHVLCVGFTPPEREEIKTTRQKRICRKCEKNQENIARGARRQL